MQCRALYSRLALHNIYNNNCNFQLMPSIRELAKISQKQCWSKVDYMWHYLGLYVAKPLLYTKITPNQVTVFWIMLEIIAAIMVLGPYWYRVSGILIFNFIVNLLDFTDGNIARIKNIKTLLGIYLDRLGIYTGMPLFLLALGLGTYIRENDLISLYAGIICCISLLYDKLLNVNPAWYTPEKWSSLQQVYLTSSLSKKNIFSYISELFRKTQPLNLLFFGIILDQIKITLIIYAIIGILSMLKKLYEQVKAIRRIDTRAKNL